MQFDQFVGQVQARCGMSSNGQAIAAIRATLETLSERLGEHSAQKLGAELPREVAEYLHHNLADPERFDATEFYHRVADREHCDLPAATYHARCVVEVVEQSVTPGAVENLLAQLPEEYRPLLKTGSKGKMSRPN